MAKQLFSLVHKRATSFLQPLLCLLEGEILLHGPLRYGALFSQWRVRHLSGERSSDVQEETLLALSFQSRLKRHAVELVPVVLNKARLIERHLVLLLPAGKNSYSLLQVRQIVHEDRLARFY